MVLRIFAECIDPVKEPDNDRWDEFVDPGVYEKWICGEEVRGCFPLFWTGTSSCFFRNSRMICTGFCEKCRSVESAVKTRFRKPV